MGLLDPGDWVRRFVLDRHGDGDLELLRTPQTSHTGSFFSSISPELELWSLASCMLDLSNVPVPGTSNDELDGWALLPASRFFSSRRVALMPSVEGSCFSLRLGEHF